MKKLIFAILMMAFILPSFGQEIRREGKTFIAEKAKKEKKATEAKFTGYYYTIADSTYEVLQKKPGGSCFIIRISGKTGNPYPFYLPKEVSAQINEELGTLQRVKQSSTKKKDEG